MTNTNYILGFVWLSNGFSHDITWTIWWFIETVEEMKKSEEDPAAPSSVLRDTTVKSAIIKDMEPFKAQQGQRGYKQITAFKIYWKT